MSTETNGNTKNSLATASMVLGILAAICIFIFGAGLASLLGISAIVTGIISLNQIKKQGSTGKGSAVTGIVLGTLPIIFMFLLLILGPIIGDVFDKINNSLNSVGG